MAAEMGTRELMIIFAAVLFAVLLASAAQSYVEVFTPEEEGPAVEAKRALLKEADLMKLHNTVYAQVGEERWVGEVRPQFMSELTALTIRETGNPFPKWQDVVEWTKKNPQKARGILERYLKPIE